VDVYLDFIVYFPVPLFCLGDCFVRSFVAVRCCSLFVRWVAFSTCRLRILHVCVGFVYTFAFLPTVCCYTDLLLHLITFGHGVLRYRYVTVVCTFIHAFRYRLCR